MSSYTRYPLRQDRGEGWTALLMFIAVLPVALAVTLWQAFAARLLYDWFVRPLNPHVFPVLTTWEIVGLLLLISIVRVPGRSPSRNDDALTEVIESAIFPVLMVGAFLLLGWFAHVVMA